MKNGLPASLALGALLLSGVGVVACSSSTPSGPAGGFVSGANNEHCVASVYLDAGSVIQADAGQYVDADGNVVQEVGLCAPVPDGGIAVYGNTNYGNQAADDDCKYNVTAAMVSIYENTNVTFVVTVTSRVDGGPVVGANALAEVFLCEGPSASNAPCPSVHPAPPSGQQPFESPPGTYNIGPIQFDAPGNADAGYWTTRFHFFETCDDGPPQALHGHAAFYVDVP